MQLALVTSCRNPGSLLRDTVASVLALEPPAQPGVCVDYAVVDAASEDGTAEYLGTIVPPPWLRLTVISEPDGGLYDGLAKGFRRVSGDWFGYVNAGDLAGPGLIRTLALVGDQHPDVEWVTGLRMLHGHSGRILHAELPLRYRGDLLARGVYGRSLLPSVQQEATFWSARLMGTVLDELGTFELAGDLWMWSRFATALPGRRFPLTVVRAHLGGFRAHPGHLSRTSAPGAPTSKARYLAEAERRVGPVRTLDRWRARREARRWGVLTKVRRHLPQDTLVLTEDEGTLLRWPLPARRAVTPLRWLGQLPRRAVGAARIRSAARPPR